MKGPVRVDARSLRLLRWRARLPRLLVLGCVGVLALAGARAALSPASGPPSSSTQALADQAVAGFAEAFAREYLSWDPASPEVREERLANLMASGLEPDGGLAPAGEARSVDWTAALPERRSGSRTTIVVVAAEVAGELVHLAVTVGRDGRGYLSVVGYPALVGAPATTDAEPPAEDEVDDAELRAVCERAVRNYLAGERRDLAADLADGAVVSLPGKQLEVESVHSVSWAVRGRRVALQVLAEEQDGTTWTLRYELAVVRRERWYVRLLHVDPRSKGAGRER